ncbi:MAG TPA: GNAT family N-acetyltransferase [Streptosporangiaceae bacterium]
MSFDPLDAADSIYAQVAELWLTADPLLPKPVTLAPGCGAEFIATGADGHPTALASCEHWQGEPESLDLCWGAARRFELTTRIAGPDVAGALDGLLLQWAAHLARTPAAYDEDSAALVTWPSRDVTAATTLLRHGFTPMAVVAARGAKPAPTASGDRPPAPPGVTVKRATPADVDEVVRLAAETVRYDSYFGGVMERPWTAAALRREFAGFLAAPEPWIWLAERDGANIGMLAAEPPDLAEWIAPMAGRTPVAYLLLLGVSPGERGGGVGAALTTRFHRQIESAGIAVTLLHYAQTNPLSAPFWGRQGYRPLWTSWESRPARAIR